MRFAHARELLTRPGHRSIASIALSCGYYDQAHMIRDFHQFAGSPPSEFALRRLPDGGGMVGD